MSSADLDREFFQNYTTIDLGYTRYDLFGSNGFATLNLRRALGDRGSDEISPELVAGLPLTPNQTLTVQLSDTTLASSSRSGITFGDGTFELRRIEREEQQRLASVTWSYNTTNHPFLPTRQ